MKKTHNTKQSPLSLLISLGGTHRTTAKRSIASALKRHEGNHTDAAKALGISRASLYRFMEVVGIETRGAS